MTRQRYQYADSFMQADEDFSTQLYGALRQSPWWMVSIAVHVCIFLVAGLLSTSKPRPPKPDAQLRAVVDYVEPEQELQKTPEETDPVPDLNPEPVDDVRIDENEEADENTDDVDLNFNETFGKEGLSTGDITGPSTNSTIGLQGGAGGSPFGRGHNKDGSRIGGGEQSDMAVMDALKWLKAHQSANGGWEAAGFHRWCDGKPAQNQKPDGLGKSMYDPGVTGLALCAFLGAGYTNRGKHPFKSTVSKGLRYLKNIQDPEGCFGAKAGPNYIYNHATASLAMVEAYGMTESSVWKGSAQRCLQFIGMSRNPYFAWRYGVKPGDNDTSVTGWMMMAIKSAKLINADARRRGREAPLHVDDTAFDGIKGWLEKMTDPDYGRVGYIQRGSGPARPKELVDRFPAEKSESMTAVGVLARIFMGEKPQKGSTLNMGADLCAKLPPTWNPSDGSIDMYYWYYGALAMHQMGGKHWKIWKTAMDKSIVESQRKDTTYCDMKGSWDPIGPWGPDGGRVYSTAVLAMCLEVYYRYPVMGTK